MAGRETDFSCVLRLQEGISWRLEFGTAFLVTAVVASASSSRGSGLGASFLPPKIHPGLSGWGYPHFGHVWMLALPIYLPWLGGRAEHHNPPPSP